MAVGAGGSDELEALLDDSDGVDDATEVQQGTDPLNDASFLNLTTTRRHMRRLQDEDPCDPRTVSITLSVGDPSGSRSERYIIQVGSISHQATEFGVVSSGTYKFNTGQHVITVRHLESRLPPPDYDYEAFVIWESNPDFDISATVTTTNALKTWFKIPLYI